MKKRRRGIGRVAINLTNDTPVYGTYSRMTVNKEKVTMFSRLIKSIYFAFYFFSLLLVINPEQSYYIQQPIFLFDHTFLFDHLKYPGGLIEYISLFLSQLYYYKLIGTLVITITALAVSLFTYKIMKSFKIERFTLLVHFIPVTALFYLHSFSSTILTPSLVLLCALISFFYYLKIYEKPLFVRLTGYLVLSTILYYFTGGGGLLLFQALCLFNEFIRFDKKRSLQTIIIILFTGLIPYLAARFFFYITLEQSYFHLLVRERHYLPKTVLYILYIYYPLLILFSTFLSRKKSTKVIQIKAVVTSFIVQVVIIGILMYLSFIYSLRSEEQFSSKIQFLAFKGKWGTILDLPKVRHSNDRLVNFNVNRALYFTGRLPYDLFKYQNFWGSHALFLGGYTFGSVTMDNSELYFDLGHIRAARQWAYEAQTIYNNSPRVLKMLAITNVIEGDYKTANTILNILAKSLIHKKWAQYYLNGIKDTTIFQSNSLIQKKRSLMPSDVYFLDGRKVEVDLLALLKKNPQNKMAFEFLMAYLMLSNKTEKITLTDEILYLKQLGYKDIPQTYQEALILNITQKTLVNYDLRGYGIDEMVVNGYSDYTQILGRYNGDLVAARKESYYQYGFSYWYYLQYVSPFVNDKEFHEKVFKHE
jgi:hypothetical protein